MLPLRNGIKTILRTPGKAILYCFILLLVAILTSVAFCVNTAVNVYLADCEEYYHTIVNVEYVGEYYPDLYVYDEKLGDALEDNKAEFDALLENEAVKYFEPETNQVAIVDGLHRIDSFTYDPDYGVVLVNVRYYDKDMSAYLTTIVNTRYSVDDGTGKVMLIRADDPEENPESAMEPWHFYLVCGKYLHGINRYIWLRAEPMEVPMDGEIVTVPAFTEVDSDDAKDERYETLAKLMAQRNDACPVQYTSQVEDQLAFHQEKQKILTGRFFTDEEYATGAKVCMIPKTLAEVMEVEVGDMLDLSILSAEGDLYRELKDVPEGEEYEIVGIYSRNDDDPYKIYLPRKQGTGELAAGYNGYAIGQFRIDNKNAAEFLKATEKLGARGFRFTLYDQGYEAVVEPMLEMQVISRIFLLVCLILAAAVLCLHSHMFITRQRDAAGIMLALGSGKAHVFKYFAACSAVVAVPGILAGCLIGGLLDKVVYKLIGFFAEKLAGADLLYSSSTLSFMRRLEFQSGGNILVYVLTAALLIAAALALTMIFTMFLLGGLDRKKKKRVRTAMVAPVKRSSHLKTRLKYALISMRRLPVRSLAVIVLALVVVMFFGQLTESLDGYKAELDAYSAKTTLKGRATDISGKMIDGLIVYKDNVNSFLEIAPIDGHSISDDLGNVRFLGISQSVDGKTFDVPEPKFPTNMFEVETLFGEMYNEPVWTRTNSIAGNSRFYYTGITGMAWYSGYSDEDFKGGAVCVIPKAMQDKYGIQLGDTVRFLHTIYFYNMPLIHTVDFKVVGTYLHVSVDDVVFSPMDLNRMDAAITYADEEGNVSMNLDDGSKKYSAFTFTIDDARKLDDVRKALEEAGFSSPGARKTKSTFAVIDDTVYVNTANSMKRQIIYKTAMDDVLYFMAGLLGLAAAWLMVSSRRQEIALMRALGTQPGRIVMNFAFEQAVLCFAGLALGLLIWLATGGAVSLMQLVLAVGFFAVWVVASLICAAREVKKQAQPQLAEPE